MPYGHLGTSGGFPAAFADHLAPLAAEGRGPELPPDTNTMVTMNWVRTLRTILIAVLLVAALVAAVLGLIGATVPGGTLAGEAANRTLPPGTLPLEVAAAMVPA